MTINQALVKLSRSKFRGRFKLNDEMRTFVDASGIEEIRTFAVERIAQRLAPALPERDGHQTPLKGHPVFLAQHATATCCRSCLNHWWKVPIGIELSDVRQGKAVNLIMAWIEMQMNGGVEELKRKMPPEELSSIPFWSGAKFKCPYRQ